MSILQSKARFPEWEIWLMNGAGSLAIVVVLIFLGLHPFLAGLMGWYLALLGLPLGERRLALWFPLIVGSSFMAVLIVGFLLWMTGATLIIGVPK